MNSIDFCFWLQGYFELASPELLAEKQLSCVKSHLNLVFKHEIDPLRDSVSTLSPVELSNIHNGNDQLLRC